MNCSLFSSKRERIKQSGFFPFNCKQHQEWMIEKKIFQHEERKKKKTNMNHDEMMKMREKRVMKRTISKK